MKIQLFCVFSLFCLLVPNWAITVIYEKQNVLIPKDESYLFQVSLEKENADLIPSYVQIKYDIKNFNGSSSDYFDFFYYVSEADIECYNSAIGNGSFLFPCPFLSNNYALLRTNKVQSISQLPQLQINKLQNLNYTFIIDNSKFPFPIGSYPYNNLNVNLKSTLLVQISSSYEELAMRLITINITILAIFLFIIGCLIVREKKIRHKMEGQKTSLQEGLLKNWSRDKEQEQSDSQQEGDYTEFLARTAFTPSLLQSRQRSMFIDKN